VDLKVNKFLTREFPKTKIVCTLGPASDSEEQLVELVKAGMSVARLNMSHGDLDTHIKVLNRVRKVSLELEIPVGVMVDVPGAKYRTGPLAPGAVQLQDGDEIVLTSQDLIGSSEKVSVAPPGIHLDAVAGTKILVDDGNIELRAIEVKDLDVMCKVVRGGRLTERRGVVTPGISPSQKFPDTKAVECLKFAAEYNADFVALSNVTRREEIWKARSILRENGMKDPMIISKVERAEAIDNLSEVVDASDALMVARGDMGVEVPLPLVPVIQKDLIKRSNAAGKPVITATQMLESMIESSSPTRAEVTDVANAVFDGSDAIMLSGETSVGKFPVAAVAVMAATALEAEKALPYESMIAERAKSLENKTDDAIGFAACQTSNQLNSSLIVAFTESGRSAGRVSRYRPKAKILALTEWTDIQRRLTLRWGVVPVIVSGLESVEDFFSIGQKKSQEFLEANDGGTVVLVAGTPLGEVGSTNMLRVLQLD
tara:strand:+ start:2400 stop:3854 length:1455 start_codon:yes stop_codon:yes gene_type:complete